MKDIAKLIVYQVIYYLARLIPARPKSKHLMLVKIDEIGDYVLVRHLLHYFKSSPEYREHKITFVGNCIFRELFDTYDSSTSNDAIWIDKKKFRRNLFYRFDTLKRVRKAGVSDAINLIYSRSWRQDDVLISVSTASKKIGMQNDGNHLSAFEKLLRPGGIYSRLLDGGEEHFFDALRNTTFVENLLKVKIDPFSIQIPTKREGLISSLPPAFFIIFPGSGIKQKKWPPENFAMVANHLVKRFGFSPVVCGSSGDREDCNQFIQTFESPVLDLTGKTSLTELLSVLHSAKCLVSVDTGVVHLAAAVRCPVFGLFSGIHYGRFAPYPPRLAEHFFAIYPDSVDKMIRDGSILEKDIPMDLVRDIKAEKVIERIDRFFGTVNQLN